MVYNRGRNTNQGKVEIEGIEKRKRRRAIRKSILKHTYTQSSYPLLIPLTRKQGERERAIKRNIPSPMYSLGPHNHHEEVDGSTSLFRDVERGHGDVRSAVHDVPD